MDRLNIFGIFSLFLSLEQTLVWDKYQFFHLFFQLSILFLFFIFWKKICPLLFQFSFCLLLMIFFSFLRNKILKNQIQIFFIAIVLSQFRLVIEHDKSEVFHFSRATKNFNPPPLDSRVLEGMVLRQKKTLALTSHVLLH